MKWAVVGGGGGGGGGGRGEGEVNLGEELRTITYQRQHLSRKIARRPFSVCLINFTIFHGTRPDVWH